MGWVEAQLIKAIELLSSKICDRTWFVWQFRLDTFPKTHWPNATLLMTIWTKEKIGCFNQVWQDVTGIVWSIDLWAYATMRYPCLAHLES